MVIKNFRNTLITTLKDLKINHKRYNSGKLIVGEGDKDIDLSSLYNLDKNIEFVNEGIVDISNIEFIPKFCTFSNKTSIRPNISFFINSSFNNYYQIGKNAHFHAMSSKFFEDINSLFSTKKKYNSIFTTYLLNLKVEKK